jgi:hypothetical protein
VNTVMNLRVPQNIGKFLSSYTAGGFSRSALLHEVSLVTCGFTKIKSTTTNCVTYLNNVSLTGQFGSLYSREPFIRIN